MPETKTQLCPTHFQSYKQRAPILLYCILCSSIALVSEARTALTPLKPLSYKLSNEIDFMEMSFTIGNYSRKKEYLKIRQKIIREMKQIAPKYTSCRFFDILSDYNAVYNYIIKSNPCQVI